MRITKDDIPTQVDIPGAHARHVGGFGTAGAAGPIAAEYFSLGAGTDIAPLLQGLEDDACQAPHWGYVITGEVAITYTDGTSERCATNDLFLWPPGHRVRVVEDAELVLFSPEHEHRAVIDHMKAKLGV
jgi:hypothetical protein